MEKVTGKILEVAETPREGKSPIYYVNVQVGNETKKYVCYASKIKEYQGKELEFETKPPSFDGGKPQIVFPKEGGRGGGGKQYDQKSVTLSYAKDIAIAMLSKSDKSHSPNDVIKLVSELYDGLMGIIKPTEPPF